MSTELQLDVIEQRKVMFYEDELTAVRLQDGTILVPVRYICDILGIQWSAQSKRIKRDDVLSEVAISVSIMDTQTNQHRSMTCLPLDYVAGWLFGITTSKINPEMRESLRRYKRECFAVLAEAFKEGRLTADPTFDKLMHSDSPSAQAFRHAQAIMALARQQFIMEEKVSDNTSRIEQLEATLGNPDRFISLDQASQLSQAVKAVAIEFSASSGKNEFGGVYSELYRRYGITSYKELPSNKYEDAMSWLREWHGSVSNKDLHF